MHIRELIRAGGLSISFEFFPPKTDEAEDALLDLIKTDLAALGPTFVSCTYGAAGSSRERTIRVVGRIARETRITSMAHLTIVGHTPDELVAVLDEISSAGISNVLALGGDPPRGVEDFAQPANALPHAIDLVRLIHDTFPGRFGVGVAGFPETHPAAPDFETDVRHLVEKVSAGADFVLTQFFFEPHHYWRLVEAAAAFGLPEDVPIIPGIMPVTNLGQIKRFAELSGAAFPEWLSDRLRAAGESSDDVRKVGIEVATELCENLLKSGVPGLHFYTLNKSPATRQIFENLAL